MEEKRLLYFISELCRYAGEDKEFEKDFTLRLWEDKEICGEFVYYMEHGDFACKAKVEGYTVVDIMVWQMDHFKAWLDRDNEGTKNNGDRMLLLAFDTLLKMRKDPGPYLQKLKGDTGTDYPGKY